MGLKQILDLPKTAFWLNLIKKQTTKDDLIQNYIEDANIYFEEYGEGYDLAFTIEFKVNKAEVQQIKKYYISTERGVFKLAEEKKTFSKEEAQKENNNIRKWLKINDYYSTLSY